LPWRRAKPVTEAKPLCFVVGEAADLRQQVAAFVGEAGLRVEQFPGLAPMLEAAAEQRPALIFLDIALGSGPAIEAIRSFANGKPRAIQLISAQKVETYEQVCAVGQVRIAGDRLGLKMPHALQPPLKPDPIRKLVQELGLRRDPKKPTVTLNEALKHNWLELWYQPKISLQSRRLAGAEGLIRLRHPQHGVMFPGSFLPGASEDDMLAMTGQVIATALRDWDDCYAHGVSVKLSVNAPVSALTKLPIAQMVREQRPKEPNWPGLIIEVTEDEIIHDLKLANEVASELRAHQCSLAIDDFGAGYSSLARLRQLPFSELKIDRSYVTNCHKDRVNAGMLESIVELAHRFGLKSVAEGVETWHESHKLQGIGCQIAQGYLFAKPMAKDQFVATLRRRRMSTGGEQRVAGARR
jgi:EAL domain-containing protein (putative c-di-GMP-specific phosphodiesterase class I)/CheY-like chemotaxis protein